ncbi:MAG TPA: hypothetical protein VMZ91_02815 [Candidatus Paceibacterota bacterium]|nr:hypothetical protein [Candidatus Paceibacterota bacterium]
MKIEEKDKKLNKNKGVSTKMSKKKTIDKSPNTSPKPILSKKDNVELTSFHNLEGKFLLVKVGDKDHVADDLQIKKIQEQLVKLFEDNNVNCVTFVTHHLVSIEVF